MAKKGIYQKYECTVKYETEYFLNWFKREGAMQSDKFCWNTLIDAKTGVVSQSEPFTVDNASLYVGAFIWFYFSPFPNAAYYRGGEYEGRNGYGGGYVNVSRYEKATRGIGIYSRGTYLTDTIADYGSLPADGRHTDGYWYVFLKMASDLKCKVNDIWKDVPTGYVNIGGVWKPQAEFKANVQGIYK